MKCHQVKWNGIFQAIFIVLSTVINRFFIDVWCMCKSRRFMMLVVFLQLSFLLRNYISCLLLRFTRYEFEDRSDFQLSWKGPERSIPPPPKPSVKIRTIHFGRCFSSCRLRSTRSSYSSILFRILQVHTCFLPAVIWQSHVTPGSHPKHTSTGPSTIWGWMTPF